MDPKPQKQSTSGASTQAKPPKLKDSCTACASSKLRCSKDKPVCRRCELRGLSCQYDTSKRTGRTSHATKAAQERRQREEEEEKLREEQRSQCQPPPNTPSHVRSNSTFASSQAPAPVAQMIPMGDSAASPLSLPTAVASGQDPFAWINSLNPEDMSTLNEMWTTNQQDFDLPLQLATLDSEVGAANINKEALPEFGSYTMVDPAPLPTMPSQIKMSRSATMPKAGDLTSRGFSYDSLSSYNDKWNQVSSSASSISDMSFQDLMSSTNFPAASCTSSIEPSNCCLSVAISFLVQLTPNPNAACAMAGNESGTNVTRASNIIIQENRQIIDELTKVLSCRCSQDGYLLTIISLVLFKAMSWYAGILEQNSSHQDGLGTDGATSNRKHAGHRRAFSQHTLHTTKSDKPSSSRSASARLVLSELHRIQRLVNLLSQKMEDVREQGYNSSGSSSKSSRLSDDSFGGAMASNLVGPMSSASFTQLEADLRECLGQISCEMIDILRSNN